MRPCNSILRFYSSCICEKRQENVRWKSNLVFGGQFINQRFCNESNGRNDLNWMHFSNHCNLCFRFVCWHLASVAYMYTFSMFPVFSISFGLVRSIENHRKSFSKIDQSVRVENDGSIEKGNFNWSNWSAHIEQFDNCYLFFLSFISCGFCVHCSPSTITCRKTHIKQKQKSYLICGLFEASQWLMTLRILICWR